MAGRSGFGAATWLQHRIEAQQLLDDIEYGLRSIKACSGSRYCTGVHAAQLDRASSAAALFLDLEAETVRFAGNDFHRDATAERLREAKTIARETLAETKLAMKQFGWTGARQLRLGIAEQGAHEGALAA